MIVKENHHEMVEKVRGWEKSSGEPRFEDSLSQREDLIRRYCMRLKDDCIDMQLRYL
jgi:hypothetical protein